MAEDSRSIASEVGDARAEWRALQLLGEFEIATDVADGAMAWLQRALELARREGLAACEAISIYSCGVARWISGDLALAEELVSESSSLFDALHGSTERIPSLLNIAELRTDQFKDRPGLRIVFEDTLQPFLEVSCDAAASYALVNRAGIARARGDLARSRVLLDESAARFAVCDDGRGKAAVLVRRAYLDLAEGDLDAARGALEEALALRRTQFDRRGMGLTLAGLGLIETQAGDHEGAARRLAEARGIFRRAGDRWGLASTLWRTADLALAAKISTRRRRALQEARAILGATERESWIANTLVGLAEVARLRGNVQEASELLADARSRYDARDDVPGLIDVRERMRSLAKKPLSEGKGVADRTSGTPTRKGRGP